MYGHFSEVVFREMRKRECLMDRKKFELLMKQATNVYSKVLIETWKGGVDGKSVKLGELTLQGTTFSGASNKTTLGNSWRSLNYIEGYIGIANATLGADIDLVRPNNFGRTNTFYGVSGDDCFIVTERANAAKLKNAIETNSCNSGAERRSIGFGQVIKKIDVYEGIHIDFCSKLFVRKGNQVHSCKNLRNVLFKSHTYTGGNLSLSSNVMEHSYLVGLSVLMEASTSLEIAYGCMRMRIGKSWADRERLKAA